MARSKASRAKDAYRKRIKRLQAKGFTISDYDLSLLSDELMPAEMYTRRTRVNIASDATYELEIPNSLEGSVKISGYQGLRYIEEATKIKRKTTVRAKKADKAKSAKRSGEIELNELRERYRDLYSEEDYHTPWIYDDPTGYGYEDLEVEEAPVQTKEQIILEKVMAQVHSAEQIIGNLYEMVDSTYDGRMSAIGKIDGLAATSADTHSRVVQIIENLISNETLTFIDDFKSAHPDIELPEDIPYGVIAVAKAYSTNSYAVNRDVERAIYSYKEWEITDSLASIIGSLHGEYRMYDDDAFGYEDFD